MKLKLTFLALSTIAITQAAELRVGKGTFDWNIGVSGLMDTSFSLDTTVYTLANPHDNFSDSKYYFFYDADLYTSDFVDKITNFVTDPLTNNYINNTLSKEGVVSLPSKYQIAGFDMDIGIGYDLKHDGDDYFGIGLVTGLSMPVVKVKDIEETIKLNYALLEKSETDIMTYKIGIGAHASKSLTEALSISANTYVAFQKGDIDSDLLGTFDTDGIYTSFSTQLKYVPYKSKNKELYFTLGYTYKNWDVNDAKVNISNIVPINKPSVANVGFTSNSGYIGVGFNF